MTLWQIVRRVSKAVAQVSSRQTAWVITLGKQCRTTAKMLNHADCVNCRHSSVTSIALAPKYTNLSGSQRCCVSADGRASRPWVCRVSSSLGSGYVSTAAIADLCVGTDQLLEHTAVQPPLLRPAVPKLLVVVLKALPVCPELGEAALVDVLDSAAFISRLSSSCEVQILRTR